VPSCVTVECCHPGLARHLVVTCLKRDGYASSAFVHAQAVPIAWLQLVGAAAMWLACKLEETAVPNAAQVRTMLLGAASCHAKDRLLPSTMPKCS
jgi:hypothetical protein